jgi:hypothetical protein
MLQTSSLPKILSDLGICTRAAVEDLSLAVQRNAFDSHPSQDEGKSTRWKYS